MIRITKSVVYDGIDDIYWVQSFTTGEMYGVNSLKDKNHWFCTCADFQYRSKIKKECKHIKRVRIIDELRLKEKISS
ncbi:MAG: hypothetical protein L0H53_00530 [Candidatus Nitrosocosmicus sp.]|nr:hypothetical protein [Candidatus Nitrosocosmicus sp.]MDN5866022.1 hypothetical protein [Candidatus Nitrosocosmicus sp.]